MERRLRLDKGYTLVSVAKALRMPKYRLCRIEHGMYIHLGLVELYKFSELYDVSPLEILSVIPDATFENLDL